MKKERRSVDIVVISDIHLGTYGCHAKELREYLQEIKPGVLILNGDIIDFWQFSKRYFPPEHMKVLKEFIKLASKGTIIYYITGNHDETLRKFSGMKMGNISIINSLELILDGKRTWFFHGDVFDVVMQHFRWIEKVGSKGYDLLIVINKFLNYVRKAFGKRKISLSRRIKDNVKAAVKYISNFENAAASTAIQKHTDTIVCGHIHYPEMRRIEYGSSSVLYLNSGDWIENLSSLEYHQGNWKILRYKPAESSDPKIDDEWNDKLLDMNNKEVFKMIMKEFHV